MQEGLGQKKSQSIAPHIVFTQVARELASPIKIAGLGKRGASNWQRRGQATSSVSTSMPMVIILTSFFADKRLTSNCWVAGCASGSLLSQAPR